MTGDWHMSDLKSPDEIKAAFQQLNKEEVVLELEEKVVTDGLSLINLTLPRNLWIKSLKICCQAKPS